MMGAEESGGFGFGMHLPERDGVYADLLLLDLFLRERAAGRWPVSKAIAHFHEIAGPSFYLRIDVHVERAAYAETKRRLLVDLARRGADRPGRRAGRPDRAARYRRRLQVLPRGRLVAAHPGVGHGAAGPHLHRGHLAPSCATRCSSPASGWCAAHERPAAGARRVDKPWGHELIWAHTDRYVGKILVIEAGKRLSLQRHEIKDESILVLSGPAATVRSRTTPGRSASRSSDRASTGASPTGRIHRYEAIERCELVEVSTPELDDVVRLEDDFGREGTSAP